MLKVYSDVLKLPGAWKFSLAGFITRFPMSMVNISIILLISTLYKSYSIAGQVAAVTTVAYAIFVPWLSRLVDRYGQRKVMLPAILISSLNLLLLAFSAMFLLSPWVLNLFSAIAGASSGSIGALIRSRWAKTVQNPKQLHTAYALESAVDEVVYVIGPIIATVLTTSVYPPAGLVVAVFFNITGGIWLFSQKSTEPKLVKLEKGVKQKSLLRIKAISALAIIYLCAGTMFGLCDVVVVAFAEELGAKSYSGIVLAIFACGSMLGALIYGARHWAQPIWKLLIVGIVLLGFGVSTFIFADNLIILSFAMFITGFTIAPTMTNVNNMVERVVPKNRLTEGFSWMSTSINIGVSSGAFAGGYLVDFGGSDLGFIATVIFAWIMVVIGFLVLPILRKASENHTLSND
ncbi:MFS transporter [Actinomyces sp. zg-332]|uniref:MFS transporter n=1 Tax=Actinomyces sp. zg-332 TaxID=2708340 RepID=UPI00141DA396|nr:MFS transporter [Actinomyces sp. zg-332]QPK94078.1 MFS transporter [Actinomyces sp. zg-332]